MMIESPRPDFLPQRPEIEPLQPEISPSTLKQSVKIPSGQLSRLDFAHHSMAFHRGPNRRGQGYRLILFSWAAASIDILLGLAFNSVSILLASFVMRVEFWRWIEFFHGSIIRMSFFSFIFSVFVYQMMVRIFLGFTIGEWACGLRLGSLKERLSKNYVYQVLLRSVVNFCTGFVVLPLLSLIFGQDLAGRVSGLYLMSSQD